MNIDARGAADAAPMPTVNAGARLDRLPIGRFHRKVFFLIGAGVFIDGFDLFLAGGVMAALLKEGWSTLELNAAFVSATFYGMCIGALAAGILSDAYGRRICFQGNLLLFGLASLAAVFSPDMYWLIFWRFLMGIGLGAEVVIGYAAIGEVMPAKHRGRWVAMASLLVNSSLFFSSLVGLYVIPTFGWRYMFGLVAVASILLWFMRKSMPESPRWLESKGRYAEAEEILSRIEAEFPSLPGVQPQAKVPVAPKSFFVLFSRNVFGRTYLAVAFNIAFGLTAYGLVAWLPSFFMKQGLSIASSLTFSTIMSLGAPFGALLATLSADKIGRRPSIICGSLVTAGLGLIYPHVNDPIILCAVGFILVASLYFWITAGVTYIPELFATAYRFRGTGFASTIGRIATATGQFAIVPLVSWGGVNALVIAIAGLLGALAASYWLLAIETSNHSLEALSPGKDPAPADESAVPAGATVPRLVSIPNET